MIDKEQLEGFKRAQRLAYEAAVCVASEIDEGWTELQAARLLGTYLKDCGVRSFFHEPFAWFGNRTRFDGVKNWFDFNPKKRFFCEGDVGLLDVAPVVDGYVGDIGYSFCPVKHEEFDRARRELVRLRNRIYDVFNAYIKCNTNDGNLIYNEIDLQIKRDGFDNIHQLYPFSVLGHRVHRMPFSDWRGKSPIPFNWQAIASFLSHGIFKELLNAKHKGGLNGFWAIEPHIGLPGFGVKFEEILVVDGGRAYWLDDTVPHLLGRDDVRKVG